MCFLFLPGGATGGRDFELDINDYDLVGLMCSRNMLSAFRNVKGRAGEFLDEKKLTRPRMMSQPDRTSRRGFPGATVVWSKPIYDWFLSLISRAANWNLPAGLKLQNAIGN